MAQGDPEKAFDPATAAVRKPGTTVRIELVGDSTQTDHAGYGRGFCANLTAAVDCVNMAAAAPAHTPSASWANGTRRSPQSPTIC